MKDVPTPEEYKQRLAQQSVPTPAQNREWLRKRLKDIQVELGIMEGIGGSVAVTLEEDDTMRRVRFCALVDAAGMLLQKAENVLYGGH